MKLEIRAVRLFPALFPDAWKHDVVFVENPVQYKCKRCKKTFPWHGNSVPGLLKKACDVPPPIDINWDNAMRLFRRMNRDMPRHLQLAMKRIYDKKMELHGDKDIVVRYFLAHATPDEYIEAACIAKEKE